MKIIDFHTHIFPDALANRAMDSLKKNAKGEYMPVHDFTCKGLISAMNNFGIDISVVMPVATKPTHSDKNMDWGLEIASDRVIPFAGLFPDDNWKANVDRAVSLGYKGIKLHPEYQNFILDDPVMLKRYDYALNKGLIILFHAGYDPIGSDPLKSNPKMFKHLLRELRGGTIIAAHLGGQQQWQEVEDELAGEDIYFDTSMGTEYYGKEQFKRILAAHGDDKILFATDSPWSDAGKEIANLNSWDIPAQSLEKIFHLNAEKLLKI
ncbi:MAG TPA: amidohydrolase family protein [Candidatus Stercoripulliclostridium merdigallinarum]|uniref:Amidohydrolase family protein n=1 Tax=Candidatus Stercoripulliclostridium merdigallinarum TaxID=2840951 RepID=A0A9D1MHL3_9FIRM|nr:amidohydrolase family protein [Candidatus Stercoripulliclostridium merdigallinarum]